jgi:hypothetical protein
MERSSGDHHVLRLEQVTLRLDDQTLRVGRLAECICCQTRAQWCVDEGRIALDESYDVVA